MSNELQLDGMTLRVVERLGVKHLRIEAPVSTVNRAKGIELTVRQADVLHKFIDRHVVKRL